MFSGWDTSNYIAAASAGISGLALLISGGAITFTFLQYRIARRKEQSEINATNPVVEPRIEIGKWPNWYVLTLTVRNREAVAIRCTKLSIIKPATFSAVAVHEVGYWSQWGSYEIPANPPTSQVSREATVDEVIRHEGAQQSSAMSLTSLVAADVGHIEFLLLRTSTTPSKVDEILEMSLRVERINESVPYRDIPVVTRIPIPKATTAT